MISAEKKLLYFIEKHIHLLFAGAVLLIGCCMRIAGFHFLSHDAKCYLLKWYDQIAANGISEQVGNYNIPYQLIIYLLTKLPLKPLHAYKVVSCAFDLAMALLGGYIVWDMADKNKERKGILAFTFVFCSPIVLMNSSVWAQCDSMYAFFGIAALYFLFREKFTFSFILLGLSFAFKLQAIFFLPFFLIYYVCRKKYSIFHFLIIPMMMAIASLPGLIAGHSPKEILGIYIGQTNTFNRVYANFPSVYALLTNAKGSGDYPMFRKMAILFMVLMLGIGLYFCIVKKVQLDSKKVFWGILIWSLYTCCLFLPNMHERYAYVLEVVAILYCFLTPAGIPFAIVVNLLSIFTYGKYLFGYRAISLEVSALINLIAYVSFTYWLFSKVYHAPDHHSVHR